MFYYVIGIIIIYIKKGCIMKKKGYVMKKLFLTLTVSLLALQTYAVTNNNEDEEEERERWALTLKNGYFYPQECILREIFDRCGGKGGYWVEGAFRYRFWKGLNAEVSGSYFKHDGIALCGCECTEVKIPTLGLGLKYFCECHERVEIFVGAGLRVFFYRERNCSPYVCQCVDETTVGGMVNVGVEFNVYKGFFIDLFADYNFKKLCPDCCNNCCGPCGTSCCGSSCETCCTPCCSPCGTCCNPCGTSCGSPCGMCCPSCCYEIHVGGFVGGIGIGYKF